MSPLMIRFFAGVLLVACARNTVAKEINALVGSSVDLPCSVDMEQCGELHSIRWYQNTSRIYVFSRLGFISRAEGNATKRMSMEYHLNTTKALLKISKVELQDEASYTCEIIYLEVNENCDGVQVIKLQTMVEPEPPRIISTLGEPHKTITNTTFGPYDEGAEIQLVCEAGGGKPEPIVKWYNGSQEMTKAQYSSITNSEGLSTGTAKLDILLSRGDLGTRYECRVTSAALKEPMVSHLIMDVHVAKEINALVGSSVDLPCTVDTAQCGQLHSVKWYRDPTRIYVYSQLGLISRAEGNATKRMSMEYHLNSIEALLKISKVELQDEASYRCQIIYLEVNENCDGVQVIKLQTMVEPEPPRIISTRGEPHQTITNTTFGPYDEGAEIQLVCEAGGGKPEPIVKWYNGSQEMTKAQYSSITDSEGLSTGTAKLDIVLSRGDLGARYECRVTSAALKEPMVSHLIMDVHVAKEINALVGSSVDLPCTVDTAQCGELHSIKWYQDFSRIYVYSQLGLISRAEGNATKRMSMEYHLINTEALLKISEVELQDEASYKCEIMYLEVRENCDGVQVIKLQTMVEPEPPRIISTRGEPHQTITNTTFGPYDEGAEIQLVCEASGGKPEPIVKWYNGSQEMTKAQYSSITDSEGLSTGTAKLDIMLSRGDLGARYECRVTSTALKEPMVSHLIMDVHVKPLLMKLGFQEQVAQGNDVLLSCNVFGSNPAADVKWFNNSNLITNESLIHTVAEAIPIITKIEPDPLRNGTFITKSHLQFKPTRFDNGKRFHCFAENSVTLNQQDLSFHKQVFIQVKYRPVVTVSPENTTVNESSNENSQDILIRCMYESNPVELKAVYWMKDGKNITLDKEIYEGASPAHPPLYIKNVTRDDMGEYVCICKNEVGASQSENSAILNVQSLQARV